MKFNLDEMSVEELDELLKKIQAKLEKLANPEEERDEGEEGGEGGDEQPDGLEALSDDLDELEKLIDDIEGRKAAITQKAEKRAALIRKISGGEVGKVVRTFEINKEEKPMEKEVFYREAWLKKLQGKDISAEERTALANGSYVIPQETVNKIYGKMELFPLISAVDVMHIPGTVIVPVEGTVNNAAVVAMDTAATDSADAMAEVSLGIYKLIKTVEITADVAAMAIPAFEEWLVDRLGNKLSRLVAKLIASGDGSSKPYGLTTITATDQTYTKAAITFTDILAIIAKLPTEYTPNASFVMSRTTFWQNVLAVKDSDNRPIVVADAQSPAKFNVLGFPVILEDEVGTDIIFGDLKEGYVFNFGKDPEVSRDSSVEFRKGSEVFRVMALGDGKPTGVGLVRYTKAT
jgi:HK97 family phage major capsid protein